MFFWRRQWHPTPVLLPGKSHGWRTVVGCSPWGWEELVHFSLSCTGEGNCNLLQYSCLESPRDREAWWAAVCGVAQSWTRLKQLSSSSSFIYDPVDIGNLISGFSAFSKSSLNLWKFMVQVLLKPGLENFEHYFAYVWDECNCVVVWACLGIAFLWDWNENWPFPGATGEFSKFSGILSAALSQHHLSGFEIAQLQFHHVH